MVPVRYRASFSHLLRHPWQLALALLGIAIGVAVIVAVDLANSSARKAFTMSMDAIAGEATHQVIGGPGGVPDSVYTALRAEHGVRSIAPIVEGDVDVGSSSFQLLGVDVFAESDLRTFTGQGGDETLIRAFLVSPGAVTTSAATASELGLEPGDEFTLVAGGRTRSAMLVGTFEDELGNLDRVLVVDIATAQGWLGLQGRLTRIDVRLDQTEGAPEQLAGLLPDGTRLLSAAGRTRATIEMSSAFATNLTAMSLLALLVGLFLIYNSVSFSVLQRRGLIGTLRALGLTRREVFGLVLTEAAVLGGVAALLGLGIGILLGEQLLDLVARSINDLYFRVNVTQVSIERASLLKGLAAGVGAALVAAAVPAFEASSYAPRLALARSTLEGRAGRSLPYLTLAGVVTMLLAVVLLLLSERDLVAGLSAVFLLILGFSMCVPIAVRLFSALLAPAAQALGGTPARVAVSGIAAGLSRTGVAVVALSVAVSATIGVSIMVDSFRGSVSAWLDQTLQADIYAGVEQGTMDPVLIEEIVRLPGVEHASTSRRTWIEDESGRHQLVAIRMAPGSYAGTDILDADPARVWPRWESEDAVLVSEPFAYLKGVRAGDTMAIPTRDGGRRFEVLGVFQSYDISASAVMMSRANYDRYFDDRGVNSLGLYLRPGVDVGETIKKINKINIQNQIIRVNSNKQILDLSLEIFDQTFVITDVLYWLAMGVAFIGILGAALALQLERAREFALFRALGMTPLQVGGMITGQAAVIGLLSGIAAVPLGTMMAVVLIKVINRRAFGWQIDVDMSAGIMVTAVVFAVVTALLASLYPAWRAAQTRPAVAMREE